MCGIFFSKKIYLKMSVYVSHIQSMWKLLGLHQTEDEFGLIVLILHMIL